MVGEWPIEIRTVLFSPDDPNQGYARGVLEHLFDRFGGRVALFQQFVPIGGDQFSARIVVQISLSMSTMRSWFSAFGRIEMIGPTMFVFLEELPNPDVVIYTGIRVS